MIHCREVMKSVGMLWKVASFMQIVVDGHGQRASHRLAVAA